MVQGGLIEKMVTEQKFVGSEGIGHANIGGEDYAGQRDGQCEGLRMGG